MKRYIIHSFLALCASLLLIGCDKLLETKPDKKLAVPSTTEDLQAMLDTYNKMNERESAIGETGADNYFLTPALYNTLASEDERNMYIWDRNILLNSVTNDWYSLYEKVNYCNAVIEGYDKMKPSEKLRSGDVLGQALLFRSSAFLNGLTIWAKVYNPATATTDLGIPMRLNTDFNEISFRSTIQECYDQVIKDLKYAAQLLNVTPVHVVRPSKPAAYGLLARTYLFMGRHEEAGRYADSCLMLKDDLLDYNDLDRNAALPFSRFNKEVIFELSSGSTTPLFIGYVDPLLYESYSAHDLRKQLFFKKAADDLYNYKGSYEGHNARLFWGVATDEMYLTRAECYARLDKTTEALADLNKLLVNRWEYGHFEPVSASTSQEALIKILSERRKQLIYRGLRWPDLKRYNKESPDISLSRDLAGKFYTLPPNDPRYAFPIPENVIQMTGMPQN